MPAPKNKLTLAEIDELFDVDTEAGKIFWKKTPDGKGKAIVCLDTGMKFANGQEAATFFGVSPMTISNHARSGSVHLRLGLRFGFANDKIEAGFRTKKYWQIEVAGRTVYAHKVIWAKHHSEWPDDYIDHINGDGFDNRISNLRRATAAENAWNSRRKFRKPPKSGYRWVVEVKLSTRSAWRAVVPADGKTIKGPYRKSPEEAYQDALAIAKKHRGEFFNPE